MKWRSNFHRLLLEQRVSQRLLKYPAVVGRSSSLALARMRSRIRAPWLRSTAAAVMAATGILVAAGPWIAHGFGHSAVRFLVDCVSP